MRPFRASRGSFTTDASPSVSLERGGYRMRAPRLPVSPLDYGNSSDGQRMSAKPRTPTANKLNQSLVVLLATLTVASITCFTLAYYLFTSRWELISWKEPLAQANGPTQVFAPRRYDSSNHDNRLFLAYLPHSGVHNQRIALENALVLARLLNRTLLIPPIRFGTKPVRYLPFDTLSRSVELSTSEGLVHCAAIPSFLSLPLECLDSFDSRLLPWTELFDFSDFENGREIIFLDTLTPSSNTDIPVMDSSTTLQIRDELPYQYRFVDDEHVNVLPSGKYSEHLPISRLRQVHHKFLQVGTLFGTSRLLLGGEGTAMLNRVRRNMVVRHSTVDVIAKKIVAQLPHRYIGLHLRLGDGSFAERRTTIVRNSWRDLLHRLGLTSVEIQQIERTSGGTDRPPGSSIPTTERSLSRLVGQRPKCDGYRFKSKSHGLPHAIFVSTDLKHPRTDPLFAPFRHTFPCLYFLFDFQEELKPLHQTRSPVDGLSLFEHLVPFVEALVAAHSDLFVGTHGSTFSNYIERTLRPAYPRELQSSNQTHL
ncbi:hypothetical protein MD484_g4096, partial [Candolleomyces efflorescens]